MKQINFPGCSVVTGTAIADALTKYLPELGRTGSSRAVHIPVQGPDGSVSLQSFVLTPATSLGVSDSSDLAEGVEDALFPVPDFPPAARVARSVPSEAAERRARVLERALTWIE
ncbi:hypothetical protein [Homoserinimonas sp. OAct 916]|uniref:hypothetical protein n=1 Tax=Homoserinimonas sp. OAct 916 TaxID=2211450 RepID=UPI000DBE2F68|nr:hypothetical protein [Homoserinimonas sp. OAct 916]